jgi:hypothetical protein
MARKGRRKVREKDDIETEKLEILIALYKELVKDPSLRLSEIIDAIRKEKHLYSKEAYRLQGRCSHYAQQMLADGLIQYKMDGKRKRYYLTKKGQEMAETEWAVRVLGK